MRVVLIQSFSAGAKNFTFGEIFSSGGATLHKNLSDQTVITLKNSNRNRPDLELPLRFVASVRVLPWF